MLLLLQPLSRHKGISCLDVYCHSSPFTLLHILHLFFKQSKKEKKKPQNNSNFIKTILKLSASPVAGVYSTDDVFPLQIRNQLHNSVGQNKAKSPSNKNVPGCLGISWKSPVYHSTEIGRDLRENIMKVDANLPFPVGAHLYQCHRRASSCPSNPPAIIILFLKTSNGWRHTPSLWKANDSCPSPFIPPK